MTWVTKYDNLNFRREVITCSAMLEKSLREVAGEFAVNHVSLDHPLAMTNLLYSVLKDKGAYTNEHTLAVLGSNPCLQYLSESGRMGNERIWAKVDELLSALVAFNKDIRESFVVPLKHREVPQGWFRYPSSCSSCSSQECIDSQARRLA